MVESDSKPSGPVPVALPVAGDVGAHVRRHLGTELQGYFILPAPDALPEHLARLVARFDAAVAAFAPRDRLDGFREALIATLPALRTFAFSLAGDGHRADDLVQETFVRAWASQERFAPGSNMIAWLFTILRNQFYSELRKRRREIEDAEGAHAATLVAMPEQEGAATLRRLEQELEHLPEAQRLALLLVGAEGCTYEEAAERLHCRVGTVKSRVSRARDHLAALLGVDGDAPLADRA